MLMLLLLGIDDDPVGNREDDNDDAFCIVHSIFDCDNDEGDMSCYRGCGAEQSQGFISHVILCCPPRKAISVTILVGMSCDFCLHLAESYSHSRLTSRTGRAQESVIRTGSPISAAALTTVIAMLPLLLCTIQVLWLSLLHALFPASRRRRLPRLFLPMLNWCPLPIFVTPTRCYESLV